MYRSPKLEVATRDGVLLRGAQRGDELVYWPVNRFTLAELCDIPPQDYVMARPELSEPWKGASGSVVQPALFNQTIDPI